MSDKFIIDESNYKDIKSVDGKTSVELRDSSGIDADANELCHHLLTVSGIHEVGTLHISYNPCLKDVKVIGGFPNLRRLWAAIISYRLMAWRCLAAVNSWVGESLMTGAKKLLLYCTFGTLS